MHSLVCMHLYSPRIKVYRDTCIYRGTCICTLPCGPGSNCPNESMLWRYELNSRGIFGPARRCSVYASVKMQGCVRTSYPDACLGCWA